ncbi:MAG: hypothetical protein ABJA37_03720 [Ferruginibacter sp.]
MSLKNYRFLVIIILCFVFGTSNQNAYGKNVASVYVKPITDSSLNKDCSDTAAIAKIILDAIELGAPIYNAGLPIGCYRVYEWAAYKILYVYGNNCKDVEKILKAAVEKSHGDYSDMEKAWLMRAAFDKILGVPTKTGDAEKNSPEKENSIKG